MRTLLPLAVLLLAAAACGGAGKKPAAKEPAALAGIADAIRIAKRWSADIGGTPEKLARRGLRIVLDGDRLYAADGTGNLLALDAESGKKIWKRDTETRIAGGPGAAGGIVVVGTDEGEVLAYDAGQGKRLWNARVSSEVLAPPAVGTDSVLVRTLDGKLFRIAARSGRKLWVYSTNPPPLTLHGASAPVLHDNIVLAGFDSGNLAAIELSSGKPLWEIEVSPPSGRSELERMVDVDAELEVVDHSVYASSYQGNIAMVNLLTGRISWTHAVSSYSGLAADDSNLYVTDDEGRLLALDRATGEPRWQQDLLRHRRLSSPPAVFDRYVVCGDEEGYLHWFRRSDGSPAGRVRLASSPVLASLATERLLYAYAASGEIAAFSERLP
ncbi:MAG: outer membrane protein assembly factor BamB [Gammaproteobacteria bacterium]|nr:outer membrane protein assembly factor BamB [Gammaproteobacteria bacterium]MDD9824875.1 outer membrane protein assembly factor BamB [Gammaproteobacteria bacterium]